MIPFLQRHRCVRFWVRQDEHGVLAEVQARRGGMDVRLNI
jgi:hypothetical protein